MAAEVASVSPTMAVFQVLSGFWSARAVYIAAKLGLADLVKDEPRTAAELAVLTGTHAPSLYRVLRAWPASVGSRKMPAGVLGQRR